SARRVTLGDESPEFDNFCTIDDKIQSPFGSPTANTRASSRRIERKENLAQVQKSPQVGKSPLIQSLQPSPLESPNGGARRSLRLKGTNQSSPQNNQSAQANKDLDAQKVDEMGVPSKKETKRKRGKTIVFFAY
ncbi:hypothetical protein TorRG33x02_355570, partial [Trema orientale]